MPDVKIHLWFEKEDGVYFGRGRYELLKLIDELGSLKLAAEKIGMSYRGAWGKIKKTEDILGQELIHKENNKEGYRLTEFGRLCMTEFKNFYDDVDEYAHKRSLDMLSRIKKSIETHIGILVLALYIFSSDFLA